MSELAENIDARLKELGLTPITAAVRKGYPRDMIRNVMRVDSRPRYDTLAKIADALGTTAETLIGGPPPHGDSLPERVRAHMVAKGLSPLSLASRAGLGPDYVRDLLRGKVREPGAMKLAALAGALECSVEDLLGDPDAPAHDPAANGWGEKLNERVSGGAWCSVVGASALTTGRVTLDLQANVSMGVAAQILALIEGDKP